MKPTPEQIAKLPKWAQEHIRDIERQLSAATTALDQIKDQQTPSPIYLDDWYCTPRMKRYIQSPTGHLTIQHAGVHLDIFLAPEKDGQRLHGIELQYAAVESRGLTDRQIAIMPRGINTIQLVAKDSLG